MSKQSKTWIHALLILPILTLSMGLTACGRVKPKPSKSAQKTTPAATKSFDTFGYRYGVCGQIYFDPYGLVRMEVLFANESVTKEASGIPQDIGLIEANAEVLSKVKTLSKTVGTGLWWACAYGNTAENYADYGSYLYTLRLDLY